MLLFDSAEPIFRGKQEALDVQDLEGLWRIHLEVGDLTLLSTHYTRIDQVFVIWSLICAAIFFTAQFLPISWTTQAIAWSLLTAIGTASTIYLTWFWAKVERLSWVIYCWAALMALGVALTDAGIFLGWGEILIRLCPLWLGLSAVGYLATGWGMKSRAFLLAGAIHLLGLAILPYVGPWQFFTTGAIVAGSLWMLAEVQWDMRPPIEDPAALSERQKQFNRAQHELRQGDLSLER